MAQLDKDDIPHEIHSPSCVGISQIKWNAYFLTWQAYFYHKDYKCGPQNYVINNPPELQTLCIKPIMPLHVI